MVGGGHRDTDVLMDCVYYTDILDTELKGSPTLPGIDPRTTHCSPVYELGSASTLMNFFLSGSSVGSGQWESG